MTHDNDNFFNLFDCIIAAMIFGFIEKLETIEIANDDEVYNNAE